MVGKNIGLRATESEVQIQILPLPGGVTLGILISLLVSQFFLSAKWG